MTAHEPSPRKLHPWGELARDPRATPLRSAQVYAAERDWPGYFAAVAGKPPRETLIEALRRFEIDGGPGVSPGSRSLAIDLGCGEGRDTAELLRRGWRVLAIDGHPEAIERIDARPDLVHRERLTLSQHLLEHVELPSARLLNCSFTLPFCDPPAFPRLWRQIVSAIEPGGRFAGQFFGDRDTWATLPDRTHHTRAQVEALLQPFELELFQEEEKDGVDAQHVVKHWHLWHVVGMKKD